MKKLFIFLLSPLIAAATGAQSVDAPLVKGGDTWTYRNVIEKAPNGWTETFDEITVVRATASSIYYSVQQRGSSQSAKEVIAGLDWSRSRSVNGVPTVINKPLAFPLKEDASWHTAYTEQHPNKIHSQESWDTNFKVVGYENVEVPAGKFNALKIESEGTWTAIADQAATVTTTSRISQNSTTSATDIHRMTVEPVSGKTYKVFWYVPEVKRWVKSVEEYYSSNNVRNEKYSSELQSYKLEK
jgi:hypothetical protein